MQPEELRLLIKKYFGGTITAQECAALEAWYREYNSKAVWTFEEGEEEQIRLQMLGKIKSQIIIPNNSSMIKPTKWYRIAIAASVLFMLMTSLFWKFKITENATSTKTISKPCKHCIIPGGNKATLTLANNSKIILDNTQNGILGKQGTTIINKQKDGQLIYEARDINNINNQINTISTPKGGQYQVILSDGTKVWLNAASSLEFPITFSGGSRIVKLTGEAYFEVTKNQHMPFTVKVNNAEVEVMGTHFDIMAYQNEANVNTTLLEGSVKVTKYNESRLLIPGQQALVNNHSSLITVRSADVDASIDWQRGYYVFKSENIKSIMRKIERWYNVEVVYNGSFDDKTFSGKVSRFKDLSALLQVLELTNDVHFKVEERRITVMP